jgi:pantoate--beta-alanine ligase
MQILSTVVAMQRLAKKWRRAGTKVGLVPTMGYLHDGHMSLVRAARRRVGSAGRVVLSIYVNPTQFGPKEDLSKYPRDLKRDLSMCRAEGVDAVFAPGDAEMYCDLGVSPSHPAAFSTYVVEEKLSRSMEGASRPVHFRGVTTVVAKLFNLTLPDIAVFGQKDYRAAGGHPCRAPPRPVPGWFTKGFAEVHSGRPAGEAGLCGVFRSGNPRTGGPRQTRHAHGPGRLFRQNPVD